jgi:hypothetical protein
MDDFYGYFLSSLEVRGFFQKIFPIMGKFGELFSNFFKFFLDKRGEEDY